MGYLPSKKAPLGSNWIKAFFGVPFRCISYTLYLISDLSPFCFADPSNNIAWNWFFSWLGRLTTWILCILNLHVLGRGIATLLFVFVLKVVFQNKMQTIHPLSVDHVWQNAFFLSVIINTKKNLIHISF